MSRSLVPPLPVSEKPRALAIEPAVVLVPLGLFVAVVSVAAPDGSYFPSSWGWASLAFLWAGAIGLVVQKHTTLAALDVAYLGAWLVLLAWTAASALWSETTTQTTYEVERTLLYVSFAFALAVVARRSLPLLLPSVLAGIVAVASYALATRLLPDRVGTFNSFAGYRLSEPLGYWNALSIFVVIGIVVGVGLAARAEAVVVRALSAASLVLLVPVLYFTFGRGGWIALASGIAAAIVIDPRRLQLATTVLVVAPWPALAVWRAYESPTLTTQFSQLAGASHEGGRLALTIALLAVVSAFVTAGFTLLARRVTIGRGVRRVYGTALALALVSCVVAVITAYGGPSESARRALDSIKQASPTVSGDQTNRLFSLSSNGRLDTWESALDDYQAHAVLGSGAGTFERWWLADRSVGAQGSRRTQPVPRDPCGAGTIRSGRAPGDDRRTARRRGSCAPQPVCRSGARRLRRTGRPRGGRLGLGGAGGDDRRAHVRRSPPAGRRGASTGSVDARWLDAGRADRVHRRPCRVLVRHPDQQSLPGTGVRVRSIAARPQSPHGMPAVPSGGRRGRPTPWNTRRMRLSPTVHSRTPGASIARRSPRTAGTGSSGSTLRSRARATRDAARSTARRP